MSCYQILILASGVDIVGKKLELVSFAFLNCINMLGGLFFHTMIGFVLNMFRMQESSIGLDDNDFKSYAIALSIIPISSMIGALMLFFIKNKFKNKNVRSQRNS
jgi:hypothetical protein